MGQFSPEAPRRTAQQEDERKPPLNQQLAKEAKQTLERAVAFFHKQVAVEGGYVYQVSADLRYREGEGIADARTVWVQPPGTPAVGQAMIDAYQRTGYPGLLTAVKDAAHCLVRGQLHSGGWQAHIDFAPELRRKHAYRVDGPLRARARNYSTFDDDKTQAAVRFLATYDKATKFTDKLVHEATLFALQSILNSQFPNGGFAQVFEKPIKPEDYPVQRARYPQTWSRKHPGEDYWWYYTINDHNISRTIETLFLAAELYDEPKYRAAALRAADFLLLAQMPEPQPAWAQQYNFQMEPVWARKFEPPAIAGSESQGVIQTLMNVYQRTQEERFLQPIPRALEYLEKSELSGKRLSRFYELQTNRPLYFNRQYELTYADNDLPTHYGFIGRSDVEKLRQRFESLQRDKGNANPTKQKVKDVRPSDDDVRRVIAAIDDRGAWVEQGKLRHHKVEVSQIIRSETFIKNVDLLSRYLEPP